MLLGRANHTRLHCFLQMTDAAHPRRKSAARWDNVEQEEPAGICLPKSNVIPDMVLICTGQSQGRQRGSTQNCWMKERIPHHKTSSNYRHILPVQCCCRISLPLIPITRLPPATTRYTRTTKYAWGLLYFTNYHIHDYEGFNKMFNG